MTEQWQELKETIIEMRDNDGTGTQQDVCKFLVNYMEVLEKQMQQPMRDATEEERKSVKDYVKSISKPTGVQFDAQPTDITWVVGNDGAQVAFKNMPVDKAQQICAIIGDEAQSTDADSSEFDKGEISDGYHTFNQLYHQRAILFATIVNQNKDKAWKSFKHSDRHYCFDKGGEWFIVGVDTPQGSYTYHYSKEYWDMFKCQELEYGKEWDGHTEEDVTRLLSLDQQSCRNCISRESVIEWLKDKDIIKTKNQEENARRELAELPSVTPSYNSIKTELKPCEDCISRQKALDCFEQTNTRQGAKYAIETLPSVTPRRDLAETSQDCISILNRIMEYTYGMLTAEKIGLQHLIKSMIDEMSGGGEE